MGDRPAGTVLHDIDALFRLGVVSGLSDGQLLVRFEAESGPDSELAFEAMIAAWSDGAECLPSCPGRRSRRRGCVSSHIHRARIEVAHDS